MTATDAAFFQPETIEPSHFGIHTSMRIHADLSMAQMDLLGDLMRAERAFIEEPTERLPAVEKFRKATAAVLIRKGLAEMRAEMLTITPNGRRCTAPSCFLKHEPALVEALRIAIQYDAVAFAAPLAEPQVMHPFAPMLSAILGECTQPAESWLLGTSLLPDHVAQVFDSKLAPVIRATSKEITLQQIDTVVANCYRFLPAGDYGRGDVRAAILDLIGADAEPPQLEKSAEEIAFCEAAEAEDQGVRSMEQEAADHADAIQAAEDAAAQEGMSAAEASELSAAAEDQLAQEAGEREEMQRAAERPDAQRSIEAMPPRREAIGSTKSATCAAILGSLRGLSFFAGRGLRSVEIGLGQSACGEIVADVRKRCLDHPDLIDFGELSAALRDARSGELQLPAMLDLYCYGSNEEKLLLGNATLLLEADGSWLVFAD